MPKGKNWSIKIARPEEYQNVMSVDLKKKRVPECSTATNERSLVHGMNRILRLVPVLTFNPRKIYCLYLKWLHINP